MRLLLVHDYYQQPGGEDQIFSAEANLLEAHGHHVLRYTMHNDQITGMPPLSLLKTTVWSGSAFRELKALIHREQPQVVHFHNTFPLISPAAYYASRTEGVPVVQTLPNFRLLCPAALFLRDGRVCEDCLNKAVPWPGVVHACYRKSRAATGTVAAMLSIHRALRTWNQKVDVYVALTEFGRQKFIQGGLPGEKVVVKPNFIAPDPGPKKGYGEYILFVGRLSPEKGLRTLLHAWQKMQNIPLVIAGDGPLENELRAFARERNLGSVKFVGRRITTEILSLMKGARCLIFPSEWYEGFPVTIVEAFACGLPVLTSRIGAMLQIVGDAQQGLHFTPGDAEDLASKVEWAWNHQEEVREMGNHARREYEEKYTAQRNYEMLMEIYERVMSSKS